MIPKLLQISPFLKLKVFTDFAGGEGRVKETTGHLLKIKWNLTWIQNSGAQNFGHTS